MDFSAERPVMWYNKLDTSRESFGEDFAGGRMPQGILFEEGRWE